MATEPPITNRTNSAAIHGPRRLGGRAPDSESAFGFAFFDPSSLERGDDDFLFRERRLASSGAGIMRNLLPHRHGEGKTVQNSVYTKGATTGTAWSTMKNTADVRRRQTTGISHQNGPRHSARTNSNAVEIPTERRRAMVIMDLPSISKAIRP